MDHSVALVTGASAGIGTALATGLAARGHDLVLVARRVERLAEIAASLEAAHQIGVEVLPADLETDAGVRAVEARLSQGDGPIELLVNNAGFGSSGRFHELPIGNEEAEIRLNVVALVRLTHAALVPMVERGHGGVINVSSVAGYQPTPDGATYGATKAFVSSFTNAIHEELRGTGVKAMVLAPGFTHTEFHQRSNGGADGAMPEFLWQSADEVAEAALKAYARGRAVCVPGAVNVAATVFSSALPAGITRRVASLVTRRSH